MLWNAKNGAIPMGDAVMHYAAFGSGSRTLVLLPGLGDGLRSARGMALPMAFLYRALAKDFRVLVFSRKVPLEAGSTTRDMARDLAHALQVLGVRKASVVGVSMGGMIAQHLAIDHPELVEKLVPVVTCPGPNPILEDAVDTWTDMALRGDHRALMVDNGKRIYSDGYLEKYGWMFPVAATFTKPRSYRQFLIMAKACRTHDARGGLGRIAVPTLVIGGEQDKTLGGQASYDLAAAIPGARLKMYPEYGHSVYDEAPAFLQTVLDFLKE